MRKSDTGDCPKCGQNEETVAHLLGQCLATAQLRGNFFRDYYLSVIEIMDNHHIISIIYNTNHTPPLIEILDGPLTHVPFHPLVWPLGLSSFCSHS